NKDMSIILDDSSYFITCFRFYFKADITLASSKINRFWDKSSIFKKPIQFRARSSQVITMTRMYHLESSFIKGCRQVVDDSYKACWRSEERRVGKERWFWW